MVPWVRSGRGSNFHSSPGGAAERSIDANRVAWFPMSSRDAAT